MHNKINVSLSLLFITISSLFSCDKENINKEFGQYALAVSYNGSDFLELHFVIDGKECGKFTPVPNIHPTFIEDCSGLKDPSALTNVFVLKKITQGEHTLEIKTNNGNIVKKLGFQMLNKECIFQDLSISFN